MRSNGEEEHVREDAREVRRAAPRGHVLVRIVPRKENGFTLQARSLLPRRG